MEPTLYKDPTSLPQIVLFLLLLSSPIISPPNPSLCRSRRFHEPIDCNGGDAESPRGLCRGRRRRCPEGSRPEASLRLLLTRPRAPPRHPRCRNRRLRRRSPWVPGLASRTDRGHARRRAPDRLSSDAGIRFFLLV